MYGLCYNLFVFLTIFALRTVLGDVSDKRKDRLDATFISLPINSKFWNPQLDDRTNMELIGVQYLDDSNKTVIDILDKSAHATSTANNRSGERNGTGIVTRPRRGDRIFVWGLLNLLKPWGSNMPDASLRDNSKTVSKTTN